MMIRLIVLLESCDAEELEIIDSALEITAISAAENKYLKEVQNLPKTIDKSNPKYKDRKYMKAIQNDADYAKLNRLQHFITAAKGKIAPDDLGRLTKSSADRLCGAIYEYYTIDKRLSKNDPNYLKAKKAFMKRYKGHTRDEVAALTSLRNNHFDEKIPLLSPYDYEMIHDDPYGEGQYSDVKYSKHLKSTVRPISYFKGE